MNSNYPVYIVDDDASIRDSLSFLLANQGRRICRFASGADFLAAADGLTVGPVLLDLEMRGIDGMEVLQCLNAAGSRLPIIMLSGHANTALAGKLIQNGVVDFLSKPFAHADLLKVLALADAKIAGGHSVARQRMLAHAQLAVLTSREWQVLNELARGLSNRAIGVDLGISVRTVEVHRANLMRKLNLQSFPDALRIGYAAGMPFPTSDQQRASTRLTLVPTMPASAMPEHAMPEHAMQCQFTQGEFPGFVGGDALVERGDG
jgi:two-component system response regulator FixJ